MLTCFMLKNKLRGDARVKKEALALKAGGWDVTILCWEEPGAPRSEDWRGIAIRRLKFRSAVAVSITNGLDEPGGRPGLATALLKNLRRSRTARMTMDFIRNAVFDVRLFFSALRTHADVVHAHDLDTLAPAWAAALLMRARLVYDSHELWLGSARYLRETGILGRLRDRLTERLLIRRADAVIAVTRGRIGVMREMYPGLAVDLVENCPEAIPDLPPGGLLDGMRGGGGPIVLYQGAIAYERGLEQLIEACGLIPSGSARVVMIGPDITVGVLPESAARKDVNGILTILPPVPSEKLPEITASADIGLILFRNTCPNHLYSLPNKLYEYMMAGLPIIASDLPEMAELIGRERCGILIDPEDPESIAGGILELASDGGRRAELGRNGRTAAMARYTWPAQAAVLTGIYDRFRKVGQAGGKP